MKEKISIIVPMYNAEQFIERCIKSVINQTSKEWELILINDGSTDNTQEICERYTKFNNINVYCKENAGVSEARNLGIEMARENWITFLDADDELNNKYIENALEIIRARDSDIIIGEINSTVGQKYTINQDVIYQNSKLHKIIHNLITSESDNENYDSRILGFVIGKIYKKEVIESVRFQKDIKFREDMIFNLSAFLKATNILLTSKISYNYIINTQSASFKYISNYINEVQKFEQILNNIIKSSNMNLEDELYICMTNMYMNWLKLCVMHEKSNLTKKEKIIEIRKSFNYKFWQDIFVHVPFEKLTNQYKLLYILYKLKLKGMIYFIVSLNIKKNKKTFNKREFGD
jgi:glycosyltransferase involved in cell wall biosynthesis